MLDAADGEPCGDDNPGALQFDAVSGRLDVCDTAAWTRVLVNGQRGAAASLGAASALALEVTTGQGGAPDGAAGPHGTLRVGASDAAGESNPERFFQVTAYDSDGVVRINPGKQSTLFVNREVGAPRDFHVWDGEGSAVLSVASSKVGIGTASPSRLLHVNGQVKANGFVQLGQGGTCNNAAAGAIRWNPEAAQVQYCDGAKWDMPVVILQRTFLD